MFVIPAKAGIHFDLGFYVNARTRASSMAFFVRLSRPSHLLFTSGSRVRGNDEVGNYRRIDGGRD